MSPYEALLRRLEIRLELILRGLNRRTGVIARFFRWIATFSGVSFLTLLTLLLSKYLPEDPSVITRVVATIIGLSITGTFLTSLVGTSCSLIYFLISLIYNFFLLSYFSKLPT